MSKNVLVFGGSGSLGSAIVNLFKTKGWNTISVDFRDNTNATQSVSITSSNESEVKRVLSVLGSTKVDSIICAAGGWVGGSIVADDYFQSVQKMLDFNLSSAVATAFLAGKLLNTGGVVVLTGAKSATVPTAGMIGYGISKAATHHLIKSLAETPELSGSSSLGILPVTLDTPSNRQYMPGPYDDWTPLEEVADKLFQWSNDSATRPTNGSLVVVETKKNVTTYSTI
ncbi:dihydropteridine reductase [Heterostelium album PN500]|uniref:Dihydropteridine reductase n=1 Tax=Heterostelium pallidum (strain ATCC 26659 / Pp 5 / PN500) TaxID=670386 RepID=D3AW88_HETP5|nr:dihydropteridine reductase [Heterostelium album PN500]EFA86561.1 dihydropteridine reductase [Heterostelium album PN500]|eukprot:XP_020438666.1 dihydropteridine reductase [Heterostelium album PN500]